MMDTLAEELWQFARGDLEPNAFEAWFYTRFEDAELVSLLGHEVVSAMLEADYRDARAVFSVRELLKSRLNSAVSQECRCLTWRDHQVLPLGYDNEKNEAAVLEDFFDYSVVARRTPWLECVECRRCHHAWYLAVDSVDDSYHLVRLDAAAVEGIRGGVWPSIFDQWKVVWPTEGWLELFGFT